MPKTKRRKQKKYSELETLAYRMGQVKRGLKNPDSLITESYNNGCTVKEKKAKKSMF